MTIPGEKYAARLKWTTVLRQWWRFRLARRLFLVVFGAIVAIEIVIAIPSYNNFKRAQLGDYYDKARIVTTERGPRGGRLVVLKEDGTRLSDLTRIEPTTVVDSHPAFSKDGAFVAFASTRERSIPETSLWVVASSGGAPVTSCFFAENDTVAAVEDVPLAFNPFANITSLDIDSTSVSLVTGGGPFNGGISI